MYSGATSNTVKKYIKMDKDIIILQDSTKTHIEYINTEAARPEPHSIQQIRTPDPHDPGPYGRRW